MEESALKTIVEIGVAWQLTNSALLPLFVSHNTTAPSADAAAIFFASELKAKLTRLVECGLEAHAAFADSA